VFVVGILVTILCAALFCAIAWTAVSFVVDPGISRAAIKSTIANAVIGVSSPVILVLLATLDSWVALAFVVSSPRVIGAAFIFARAIDAHEELDFSKLDFVGLAVGEFELEAASNDLGSEVLLPVREATAEGGLHSRELDPLVLKRVKVVCSDKVGVTPFGIVGGSEAKTINNDILLVFDENIGVVGQSTPLVPIFSAMQQ
jgi:hypothetical protein